MKISSIRFEPGTITPGVKRLDVVRAGEAELSDDDVGVWVGSVRVPWHRVQSVLYEHVAVVAAVDSSAGTITTQPEAQATPRWQRKRK
jgi:hypothetical protein